MRQGTTPEHIFEIPFDTTSLAKVRVVYAQRDGVKITKTENDVELSGNQIKVKLTQADTFRLNHNTETDIQIRGLTVDGTVLASDIVTVTTKKCLDREVL